MNDMSVIWYVMVSGGFMAAALLGSKSQEIKELKKKVAHMEADHLREKNDPPRVCRFPVN